MDRGAWRAAIHRVTKSWTRLRWLSMHLVHSTNCSRLVIDEPDLRNGWCVSGLRSGFSVCCCFSRQRGRDSVSCWCSRHPRWLLPAAGRPGWAPDGLGAPALLLLPPWDSKAVCPQGKSLLGLPEGGASRGVRGNTLGPRRALSPRDEDLRCQMKCPWDIFPILSHCS